ncbi:MAG: NAD+ synthase [Gammaproteobacteria bacterium RIFCSPLOWO2_02_FULL_42_14]|nr:MAG: NAD+ synthase [Gammaproteobacteria bacterium RIFCSPHIGHO2_02_FULL_42_43]OGT29153.1 MAG: NAD+ synthase [Gammaproteobacteria bacterium RIFCSPHIGHO2_01_FULL_42_8]OGT52941.1 MAG: NAD+ synthase [Gammaproteobacteria bacterium RIFCSPHIGHO2_12_FULL_41_25]OGT61285.1 MAG: NAD+ synthase [Gammaproteobacteria bacterium RIFCSPLOWO2_02_FULL_42_14]OGT87214.1 MAG: NAD+ synthase [Gammaproteobacteria bacterium RIFCSPLOWO2_12_FULL_42_18]
MKIALAQLNFLVGDIFGNANRIIQESQRIQSDYHADLIVFPELALTGYPPEDLLFRPGFYKRCERALQQIQAALPNVAIILGYPETQDHCFYNKVACLYHGKYLASYAKQELPNYTVFDEKRYFTAGKEPCVFEFQGIKIGLLICEDLWHETPIQKTKQAGAEIAIVINASPYNQEQIHLREEIIKKRAAKTKLPIAYVNCVGGQDELVFDGGSMAVDAESHCAAKAAHYEENILLIDIEKKNNKIYIAKTSLPKPLTLLDHTYGALKLGTRDYIEKNRFPGAIVGLSGGIDSALTLAIAADAIGADKVEAVLMPSRYTAKISVEDAIAQAKNLGVQYHLLPIDALLDTFLTTLAPVFENKPRDATEENLQARIRGTLLMALSNKFGKIVLTTGNKSEYSVGYTTLYGDMAGGFSVLKDVSKTMVYQLAHYRNHLSPIIPERVFTRAPSAELAPNQTDQDTLPPYDLLDDLLQRYIEKDEEPTQLYQAGFQKDVVDKVVKMINANEYKRRQAPIGIRLTQRAFGKDRRYPITSGYERKR